LLKRLRWPSSRSAIKSKDRIPMHPTSRMSTKKFLDTTLFDNSEHPMQIAKAEPDADHTETCGETVFGDDVEIYKLHGSLSRDDRLGNLNDFGSSKRGILVTTDVASRGLNFPEVEWIIQYDPPQQIDEYIHRAGRTARLGKEYQGNAVLFLMSHERGYVDLLRQRDARLAHLPEMQVLNTLNTKFKPGNINVKNLPLFLVSFFSKLVAADDDLVRMARVAFLSSLKAYSTFAKELKTLLNVATLHSGHFAASFCLTENPKKASTALRASETHDAPKSKPRKRHRPDAPKRQVNDNEFEIVPVEELF